MATGTELHTLQPRQQVRLLQLVSPSLPVGAFTYSQGLEWAIEASWIQSEADLAAWLQDMLHTNITYLEIPLFQRLHQAYTNQDYLAAEHWMLTLMACRETAELRAEEQHRGRAFARLLPELGCQLDDPVREQVLHTQLAGFAWVVGQWQIDPASAIEAYSWSWLENLTLAGVKLIPLGQTAGQRVIHQLGNEVINAVTTGLSLADDEIGYSCTAQAIASSLHETQYTRLYRS